jgi:hypothetical protein
LLLPSLCWCTALQDVQTTFGKLELTGLNAGIDYWFQDLLALHSNDFGNCVMEAAKLLRAHKLDGAWKFNHLENARIAKRSDHSSDDREFLRAALSAKTSIVIFASVSMGPDLIILLWFGDKPLVIPV